MVPVRIGIYDHFGWAVAVTADDEHGVADRRRIELVDSGVSPAPIHYDSGALGLAEAAALVERVRRTVEVVTSAALDELAAALAGPVESIALRAWPADFPTDIEVLVRPPYESRADAVMYRQVLAAAAEARGWTVVQYDAKHVVDRAIDALGDRAADVLDGPRDRLGPPWTNDHRTALAATIAP